MKYLWDNKIGQKVALPVPLKRAAMSGNPLSPNRNQPFADELIQRGWLTPPQVAEAAAAVDQLRQAGVDIDLEQLVLARGLITPQQAAQTRINAVTLPPSPTPAVDLFVTPLPLAPAPNAELGVGTTTQHVPKEEVLGSSSGQDANPPDGSADREINLSLIQSFADIGTNNVFLEQPALAPAVVAEASAPPKQSMRGDVPVACAASWIDGQQPPGQPMLGEVRFVKPGTFQGDGPAAAPESSLLKSIRQGTCLGPYRILEPLGAGSFGGVYLAEDSQSMLGTRIALKIPHYQSLSLEELERYRHEAKLWRALSQDRHPNVLELHNLNRFDGVIAFVMEYVEGGDLKEFAARKWRQGPFPLAEALRIIRSIAEALKVIHAKRVYHGDLKPANILIRREDGTVKVTDFSVSRSVTRHGDVPERYYAGTQAYMAPEVFEGKATLQSDLFALGIVFYELIAGVPPFQADNVNDLIQTMRRGQLRGPASALRPDLPFPIERIILRCLEAALEDRYAAVGELIEDLQAVDTSQDLVARLAECVIEHAAPDDLAFFLQRDLPSRGYRGDDARSLMIEYCLDEDPEQVLLSCFSKPGLARLADRLGASAGDEYADRERYAQAILDRLGLASSENPRGIHESIRFLANFQHRLERVRDEASVAGLVTPAVREYEKVLHDLLRFYGQFLYGRSHERALARLARHRLANHKRDLSRATLGERIGVLQALNEHLAGDSAEARHFELVFRRRHTVPPDLLAASRVVTLRNAFMHGHETLAGANLAKMRDRARELFREILDFLQVLERRGIYPRIIAVESFVTDHFGRKYIYCRSDQGQTEKVFTNVTVDPSRHYFFFPTTNPMCIYPILIPT